MKNRVSTILFPVLVLIFFSQSLTAGDSPEVMYQVWVEAERSGNIEKILELSTEARVKEFHQEASTPEKREEIRKMMKLMAPQTYKVTKTVISPDGKKTSLFIDAMALDFFSLNDPKAKPQLEKTEVQFVKEGDQWKIHKQCSGGDGRCEKEDVGQKVGFGRKIPLKNGASVLLAKGNASDFGSIKTKGKPYVVTLIFQRNTSAENPVVNYAVHSSPAFADFYLKIDGDKVTPAAIMEGEEAKVLEANTTYSRSKTIGDKSVLSILFDVPSNLKGTKIFWAKFNVGEQDFSFQAGE